MQNGVGAEGAAHERSALDVAEAERARRVAQLRELLRLEVALDRQVAQRRSQVLAERQEVDAGARAGRAETSRSSARVSPSPSITPDFVSTRGAARLHAREQRERARGSARRGARSR